MVSLSQRRSKYGNTVCYYRGLRFDSRLELERYLFLDSLLERCEIRELDRQVRMKLTAHGQHICDYIADHVYVLNDGTRIVEDCKGVVTPEFRIKAKLYEAQTCQPIHIVTKKNLTSLPTGNREANLDEK